jgi:Asp-tRNA(Asn)/Glu-tRNA(Gln) amidotransferase A subunit family amidase
MSLASTLLSAAASNNGGFHSPLHIITGAYYWINYLVDIALLTGAFYSGTRWFARQAAKKQTKRDAEFGKKVKENVATSLSVILPGAVDDFLDETLDDAVSESVKLMFGEMLQKVDTIFKQVSDNGGKSITDSQRRLEKSNQKLLMGQEQVLQNQAVQKEAIAGLGTTQSRLIEAFSRHLGRHEILERASNDRLVKEASRVATAESDRVALRDETNGAAS